MPAIEPAYRENFNTLRRAAASGDLVLVDCQDRATGKPVRAICAMSFDGREYELVPLAKLFDGNPYAELNPPNPEGGYTNADE